MARGTRNSRKMSRAQPAEGFPSMVSGQYRRIRREYLLIPALLFLAAVFAYPMIDIVWRSFAGAGGISLVHYRQFIDHPVYLRVFEITFEIAFTVTLVVLILGYPVAYFLTCARKRVADAIMACVLFSLFTNILVRTYAWMIILGPEGVLNQMLHLAGLGAAKLLFNRYGVLIGMAYALLPYMVLTLYSVMRGIDRSYLRAARNLGASDWKAFWHVFLPDRKSTRLNSSHLVISYAVFCLKKKKS